MAFGVQRGKLDEGDTAYIIEDFAAGAKWLGSGFAPHGNR